MHVSTQELKLPEGVTVLLPPEQTLVSVVAPEKEEVVEPVPGAPGAPGAGAGCGRGSGGCGCGCGGCGRRVPRRPPRLRRPRKRRRRSGGSLGSVLLVVGLGNPGRRARGAASQRRLHGGRRARARPRAGPTTRRSGTRCGRGASLAACPSPSLKPQTFMNLSGESVQPAAAFLKVEPADIVVVHDELDLPWKDVRLKMGGGHAGHNGLRSIIQQLGHARLRPRPRGHRPPAARARGARAGCSPASTPSSAPSCRTSSAARARPSAASPGMASAAAMNAVNTKS